MNETKWSSSWAAAVAISLCVLAIPYTYITHCSDVDKNRMWQQLFEMFSHCTCPDPLCPGLPSAHSSFIHSIFRLLHWICTEYLRLAASQSLFKLTSFYAWSTDLAPSFFIPFSQCTHWKWIMRGIMMDIPWYSLYVYNIYIWCINHNRYSYTSDQHQ